jgi:hypothetical protein
MRKKKEGGRKPREGADDTLGTAGNGTSDSRGMTLLTRLGREADAPGRIKTGGSANRRENRTGARRNPTKRRGRAQVLLVLYHYER